MYLDLTNVITLIIVKVVQITTLDFKLKTLGA